MTTEKVFQVKNVDWSKRCQHNRYLIDEKLSYVECALCGEHLNPMWVIGQFCNAEARAMRRLEDLKIKVEKAASKNRCKCEKCGKMTRVIK
jgi:hypothetical protein